MRSAASRRRTCPPGVSRTSRLSESESWRRRGNNGRFVASRPHEERKASLRAARVTDEVDYFRMADTGVGRTRSCGHFFSNSFQFVITVIGSDAASVSTELMMNFWPFGIAAQR